MKRTLQEKVYSLLEHHKSDAEIIRSTNISKHQLAGYKAFLTRRKTEPRNKDGRDEFTRLKNYMERQSGIYLPNELLIDRLRPDQVSSLVDILDSVFGEEVVDVEISKKRKSKNNGIYELPPSEVRKIVYGLKSGGLDNEEVYKHHSLKNANKFSIRAYIAHCTMGTYDNRELT